MTTQQINPSFIGGQWQTGQGPSFHPWDPVNDRPLAPCHGCTTAQVDQAVDAANRAAVLLAQKSGTDIAEFLRVMAAEIDVLGDALINTAMAETGLPAARLQGERGRTTNQLRAFADLAADGSWVQAAVDTACPDRQPLPKPDVRALHTPLGPVAVFGASNFPFAFGCLGGDTASALAAGNPVVVKGHPAHPATSSLFAQAAAKAIRACGFPDGTFSLLQGNEHTLGSHLAAHPDIRAIGFTGSEAGGRALMDIAARRPAPIPVYAEMGSINPLFILPDALAARGETIAAELAASITLGCGQFCTSPGLIVTPAGEFAGQLARSLADHPPGYMLTPGIAAAARDGISRHRRQPGVTLVQTAGDGDNPQQLSASLMTVAAEAFVNNPALQHEIFGPVALLVQCRNTAEMLDVAACLGGNLTAAIHTDTFDSPDVQCLTRQLASRAGRVLFNGYPTGVEVCPAMQHGGPYPASSAPATTSVGTAAIHRFTSRHCYQNCPDNLLPAALKNDNPLGIWRQLDGQWTRDPVRQTTQGA